MYYLTVLNKYKTVIIAITENINFFKGNMVTKDSDAA
jgi:hypothetical protein